MIGPLRSYLSDLVPLAEEDWMMLQGKVGVREFQEKELICRCGDVCDRLLFLHEGIVRSYFIDVEGREFTWSIHYNEPGSLNYFPSNTSPLIWALQIVVMFCTGKSTGSNRTPHQNRFSKFIFHPGCCPQGSVVLFKAILVLRISSELF